MEKIEVEETLGPMLRFLIKKLVIIVLIALKCKKV